MAAFTSTQTGSFTDGGTWGNTSPGVMGTDYPGLAGDTFTIASGHTVTYDTSNANALGASSISSGGTLTFDTTMDTLLTIGNVDFTVNGVLEVGTISTPIDAAYTAIIDHQSISSSNEFIVSSTGQFNLCGDPDLFGSTIEAEIESDWTSGQTFTIIGDYTSLWSSGSQLCLYIDGEYVSRVNDLKLVTINTIAVNGDNTDITINESFPGGTFSAGCMVWNIERNAIYALNGDYTITFATADSSSGDFQLNAHTEANKAIIHSASILNGFRFYLRYGDMDYTFVNRFYSDEYCSVVDGDNNIFCCNDNSTGNDLWNCNGDNWYFLSNESGALMQGCTFKEITFACTYDAPIKQIDKSYFKAYIYRVYQQIDAGLIYAGSQRDSKIIYIIGKNKYGLEYYVNNNVIGGGTETPYIYEGRIKFVDIASTITDPITLSANFDNNASYPNKSIYIEDWGGNGPRFYNQYGSGIVVNADGTGIEPSQRSGGNDEVWKIETFSNIDRWRRWVEVPIDYNYYLEASAGSLTFSVYFQTNYSGSVIGKISLAHNDLIDFEEFSISPRSNQADWSQLASLTNTFTSAGWVNLKLFLYSYESGLYIWVDPLVTVS